MCVLCKGAKLFQLCPALCDTMDHSPPGSPVHGISQARILGWEYSASPERQEICLSGDLPNPGIKLRSPARQADSLPSEPPGKP